MTLKFSDKAHRYWLDGKPVPGVTTIIGKGLPKPALPRWAAKCVAEYVVGQPEKILEDVLRDGPDLVAGKLKAVPWAERDAAALRGTQIHALAEQIIQGIEAEVPDAYADAVQGYVDLADELGITPIAVEARLASRQHWFAGTADLIAKVGGETWLLDLKTGSGIYGEYALQCAAYANADFYLDADGKTEVPIPKIDQIAAIHVQADCSVLYRFPSISEAWCAFQKVKAVADLVPAIEGWIDK